MDDVNMSEATVEDTVDVRGFSNHEYRHREVLLSSADLQAYRLVLHHFKTRLNRAKIK